MYLYDNYTTRYIFPVRFCFYQLISDTLANTIQRLTIYNVSSGIERVRTKKTISILHVQSNSSHMTFYSSLLKCDTVIISFVFVVVVVVVVVENFRRVILVCPSLLHFFWGNPVQSRATSTSPTHHIINQLTMCASNSNSSDRLRIIAFRTF